MKSTIISRLKAVVFPVLLCLTAPGFAQSEYWDALRPYILHESPDSLVDLTAYAQWTYHPYWEIESALGEPGQLHWTTAEKLSGVMPEWEWGLQSGIATGLRLRNESSDTLRLFLYPGIYRCTRLWEFDQGQIKRLFSGGQFVSAFAAGIHNTKQFPIIMRPGEEKFYVLGLLPRLPVKKVFIALYSDQYERTAVKQFAEGSHDLYLFFIILCSMLIFMALAGAMQFLTSQDRSYLYYALFVGCNVLFYLIVADEIPGIHGPISIWGAWLNMFRTPVLFLGYAAYVKFASFYLLIFHSKESRLQRILKYTFRAILLFAVAEFVIEYAINNRTWYVWVNNTMLLLMMPLAIVVMALIWQTGERLARLLIMGTVLYFIGSALGYFLTPIWSLQSQGAILWHNPYFYTGLGSLVESAFFFFALGYRLKLLHIENMRLLRYAYTEKERIAQDIHDEIGSTLSSISILSEAARQSLLRDIDRMRYSAIGDHARQVMGAMSDIIWSVNPRNDTMTNVLQRMKEFAVEILEPQGIALHFEADEAAKNLTLSMQHRKDFYLLFKEAVNNAAKYSGASDVWVTVFVKGNQLHLEVRDNGRGFDASAAKPGNGLLNMQRRASAIGGTFSLESAAGVGTNIQVGLHMPIA